MFYTKRSLSLKFNFRERTTNHVKLEWRPAASYGNTDVVGYKIFVNDRLAAILGHDQLTYTLTNGQSCALYTVHVQALSNDKEISSPMSRAVKFAWPGIRPGAFRRKDNGQTGAITVTWEHPQLEDETEDLIGYEVCRLQILLKSSTTCYRFIEIRKKHFMRIINKLQFYILTNKL